MRKNVPTYLKMWHLFYQWSHKILPGGLQATIRKLLPQSPCSLAAALRDHSTGQFWAMAWGIVLGNHRLGLAVWFAPWHLPPSSMLHIHGLSLSCFACLFVLFKQWFCWNTPYSNLFRKDPWTGAVLFCAHSTDS